MTFPSAVLTLFVLPDFPHNSKSRWLTEEERQLAIDRCARAGIAQIGGKLDMRLVKRIFGSWRIYLISITYLIVSCLIFRLCQTALIFQYATSVQDVNYMAICQ
jgi:ACS family pantothenate transporter-like MFS transporter